jgi:hypothetical protein
MLCPKPQSFIENPKPQGKFIGKSGEGRAFAYGDFGDDL